MFFFLTSHQSPKIQDDEKVESSTENRRIIFETIMTVMQGLFRYDRNHSHFKNHLREPDGI